MRERILQHVADDVGTAVNSGSEIEALGLDSLEFLQLLQWIEGEYAIVFADESIQHFDTLGDVIDYAESAAKLDASSN